MKLYNIYCKYCDNMISDRGYRTKDNIGEIHVTSEFVFLLRISDIGGVFYANSCH